MHREVCLAGKRRELTLVTREIWQVEPAWLPHTPVVIVEPRHHVLDAISNAIVILDEPVPIDCASRAKCGTREPCDDGGLAEQVRRCRCERAARHVHDAH